jgi:hypothetical protein
MYAPQPHAQAGAATLADRPPRSSTSTAQTERQIVGIAMTVGLWSADGIRIRDPGV